MLRQSTKRKFQFQTGAIKSRLVAEDALDTRKFQFQTGAIKSLLVVAEVDSFNIVSIPNWCD